MKPIILITSCAHHRARNQQCRETWLKKWGHLIDYKFVFGNRGGPFEGEDELYLDVDDTYYGLPEKVQASHKWALEQGYDWILKTDSDVYVHVLRLLEELGHWSKMDYMGNFYWDFALGGSYWLSKRASQILTLAPLPRYGTDGGDDVWVGKIMGANNSLSYVHDRRYIMGVGQDLDWNTFISLHTSGPPKVSMEDVHKKVLEMEACHA